MHGVPGLKKARQRAGKTQAELAILAGLHVVSISRLETGKMNARVRTIEKLADILECSVRELMFPEVQ